MKFYRLKATDKSYRTGCVCLPSMAVFEVEKNLHSVENQPADSSIGTSRSRYSSSNLSLLRLDYPAKFISYLHPFFY